MSHRRTSQSLHIYPNKCKYVNVNPNVTLNLTLTHHQNQNQHLSPAQKLKHMNWI